MEQSPGSQERLLQGGQDDDERRPISKHTGYMYNKLKYYRRLEQDWVRLSPSPNFPTRLDLAPPPHVLPAEVFVFGLRGRRHKPRDGTTTQSSLSTVFSIWNTMIGSTLVTLPYGFSTSGMLLGVGIVLVMGAICCYTCNLVVVHGKDFGDFGDLVQYHYGRRAQIVTMVCSVLVLLGASIAYHVLMQECLFKLVSAALKWNRPNEMTSTNSSWSPKDAALAILVLYPLTNMKNVSALVTLNSFGIPFVLYSIFFIIYHGIQASCCAPPGALDFIVITGKPTFGILGGIVTLSFFIHNAIQPIIRNSNPATQRRDVSAAYFIVGISYLAVGVLGYIGFGVSLGISENFLDAFPSTNVFAFSARISLLLQLATVYPLVLLIIRTQLFGLLLHSRWPSIYSIMGLNGAIMGITTLFAIFYPHVGDILRFTGAFGGLAMIFLLPIGIHLKVIKRRREASKQVIVGHLGIVFVGFCFLLLQFI